MTKYNKKQIVAMILLEVIAFVAYRNSGRMGILLSVLTILGLKNMDCKKLFKLGAGVYTVAFSATVILAKLGVINNPLVVHEKGGIEVIRWGMGYSTGNIFHVSFFMLVVFLCYNLGKRYDLKWLFGLMIGNLVVFLYSLSYTGVAVTALYLVLNLYAVKRKRLSVVEKVMAQMPLPMCLVFSFGAPLLLEHPLVQKVDQWMQARLTFSAYYLQNQPITLFGTRMKEVPYFWVIMDNGYVYFFMTFGIVAFVLFCAGYAILIGRCSGLIGEKKERLPELAMIFSFLLYGIMEQFLSNAFMNLSLLFMGEVLFGQRKEEADEKTGCGEAARLARDDALVGVVEAQDGKCYERFGKSGLNDICRYAVYAGVGIVIFVGWFALIPTKEYVTVPVSSLNYVNAESVQIYALNQDGTKDTLKKEMGKYQQYLEQETLLETALSEAGVTDRLSSAELQTALEYALPIYIHSGEAKDVFRIRLLKLYHDITDEEYRKLMESLIGAVQADDASRYAVKDGIYSEQIGKSFGTDRIEHMSEKDKYVVEKSGAIVELEHVRDAVFAAVCGVLIVMLAGNCKCRGKCGRIG